MKAMAIKDLIRAGRARLGMTEQRFADAAGVSRSAVQQWESGATAPRRGHQQRVANLIGISVGELMSGTSSKYPTEPTRVEQDQAPYAASMQEEALRLFSSLNHESQKEAIKFMRFLESQQAVEHRGGSEDYPISARKKRAA